MVNDTESFLSSDINQVEFIRENGLLDISVSFEEEVLFKEKCFETNNFNDSCLLHEIRIENLFQSVYNVDWNKFFNEHNIILKREVFRLRFDKWRKNLKNFYINIENFNIDGYYHDEDKNFILNLSKFESLETIFLDRLSIFKILLNKENKIGSINFRQLKNLELFDFKCLNPNYLTNIAIEGSPFFEFDIEIFSGLKKIESIHISDTKANGSLMNISNLNSLETISFDNTYIKSYLEYLPDKTFVEHQKNIEISDNKFLSNCVLRKISSGFIDYKSVKKNYFFEWMFSRENLSRISVKKWKNSNSQLVNNNNYLLELEKIKDLININLNILKIIELRDKRDHDQFNSFFTYNDLFFLLFSKYGIFSIWLNNEFESLSKYQELYYKDLVDKSFTVFYTTKTNLLDFLHLDENKYLKDNYKENVICLVEEEEKCDELCLMNCNHIKELKDKDLIVYNENIEESFCDFNVFL
ncbi:MAG: hypothetical protein AM1032_000061 [Mycoplasmataceae bacterium]|nr:MAG: hypothetical protein AM1032_000061 [Mycoplasmataceae bacterium]